MKLIKTIFFISFVFAIIASMVIAGIIYFGFPTVFDPINNALSEFDTNAETYLKQTNSTHEYFTRNNAIWWNNLDEYTTRISLLPIRFLLPIVFVLLGIVVIFIVYNRPCRMGQEGNRRLDGATNTLIFTIAVISAIVIIAYIIAIIYLMNTAHNGTTIILDLSHMLRNTKEKYPDGYGTLIEQLELSINNSTDTDAMVLTHIEDRILSKNKWQFSVIIVLASIASLLWIVFAVIYLLYPRCRNRANKVDETEMQPIRQGNDDEQECQNRGSKQHENGMRTMQQQNDDKPESEMMLNNDKG